MQVPSVCLRESSLPLKDSWKLASVVAVAAVLMGAAESMASPRRTRCRVAMDCEMKFPRYMEELTDGKGDVRRWVCEEGVCSVKDFCTGERHYPSGDPEKKAR